MLGRRVATAVALFGACVTALWLLPPIWWAVVLWPVLAIASWEWAALAGYGRGARVAFCAATLVSAAWLSPLSEMGAALERGIYGASAVFWILLVPLWLSQLPRVRSRLALAAAGWIVLVPAWMALVRLQSNPLELLALLGIIWIADSAAYFAGRAWGRHQLAPTISPGKTWEGVAGAGAALAVYYAALSGATADWAGWQAMGGVILFVGVGVLSVIGDLFESGIKRQAGAKDSGTLLPGHGGVLDRIDGITAGLPFAAFWLLVVA